MKGVVKRRLYIILTLTLFLFSTGLKINLQSTNTWAQTSRRLIQEPQISTIKGIYGRTENSITPKEDYESYFQTFSSFTLQYDTHSPIYIEGNSDFKTQANVENWPGDGTQSAPYVIDGLDIIGFSDSNGIKIKDSDVHFRISNSLLSHGWRGILLSNVSNGQLTNNIVANNSIHGIYLSASENNTLVGNTVTNNEYGIYIGGSENTLADNTVANNNYGIYISRSENTLVGNIVTNNSAHGIVLSSSGNNMILKNNLTNNALYMDGYGLEDYLQAEVSNNSVNGRPLVYWQNITSGIVPSGTGQVILVNSDFVEVTGQNLISVQASYCSNLFIHNNIIANKSYYGIHLSFSGNNTLVDNTVANNKYGIYLVRSENNTLAGNTVVNNEDGIHLSFSGNNTLTNNIANNNHIGISLDSSRNNTMVSNTVANNGDGIRLSGSGNNIILENNLTNNALNIYGDVFLYDWGGLLHYLQAEVSNNSVNGRPLVYWQNITGGIVPSGTGQVILVNSDFVEVTGQNITSVQAFYCSNLLIHNNIIANISQYGIKLSYSENNTLVDNTVANNKYGIYIDRSENNILAGNTVTNNEEGIFLRRSWNNTLVDNTVANNKYGIYLAASDNNTLVGNTVANNSWDGISLGGSDNNTLVGNTVANNSNYGIYIFYSYFISVRFNDFLGNNHGGFQAYDEGSSNIFVFNFWDDWISPDIDADGIVDEPYPIEGDAHNHDPYPRVFPLNDAFSHFLVPPKIILPTNEEIHSETIMISWIPAMDSHGHSISYTLYYKIVEKNTWILFASQLIETDFFWNLSSLQPGTTFLIKVVATCSEGLSAFDVSDDPIYIIMPTTTTSQVSQPSVLFFIIFILAFKRRKRKSIIFADTKLKE